MREKKMDRAEGQKISDELNAKQTSGAKIQVEAEIIDNLLKLTCPREKEKNAQWKKKDKETNELSWRRNKH